MFGALFDWGQVQAIAAALTLADAVLGTLGLILAALTGSAGLLVLADARADMAAVREWQDIHGEMAVIGIPAETAPTVRVGALYVAGPQDEGLHRILLTHRYAEPRIFRGDTMLREQASAAETGSGGLDSKPRDIGHVAAISASGTAMDAADQAAPATSCFAPSGLETKANRPKHAYPAAPIKRHARRGYLRADAKARLIANAGTSWDWPVPQSFAERSMPRGTISADVIVLSDRYGRERDQAGPEPTRHGVEPAQPACRGPPDKGSRRQVATESIKQRNVYREKDRLRIAATGETTVTDDLGDRIPVGTAELEVVETHLDDMLGDLLATGAAYQDRRGA